MVINLIFYRTWRVPFPRLWPFSGVHLQRLDFETPVVVVGIECLLQLLNDDVSVIIGVHSLLLSNKRKWLYRPTAKALAIGMHTMGGEFSVNPGYGVHHGYITE